MTNINVRVVGTANVTQMQASFGKLEAQVTALNLQLENMVKLQKTGVDASGYQAVTRAAAKNSQTFRNAAASTGMFEVQQLKLNKATDDYIGKLQKQKITLGQTMKGMFDRNSMYRKAYEEQLKMQNMVTRTSQSGVVHGKTMVDTIVPNTFSSKLDVASKRLGYFNEHLKSSATQMINWGKNTQWAGRQMTVGLTVPLAAFGAAAGVMAYQVDQGLTRVQKVYNTTAQTVTGQQRELDQVRAAGLKTAMNAAQQYGSAAQDTLNVQAELAAAGKRGIELQQATTAVMRISRLGELDYNDAIAATISLQSVFGMNAKELGDSFNYINDVENATSLQTQDFAKAIPIAAAPVKAFGGDIQDLGTLLVAMKSKGIAATQGANAIKAAMQRLGRPSKTVQEQWTALTKTDITEIFDKSHGLLDLFTRIGDATKNLAPKDQIRAFAGLFGTYQVTRMMAMVKGMQDLHDTTTQTGTAFKLASQDTSQWAKVAQTEIGRYQNSISGKWDIAIQTMKLQLSTLGKPFVSVATGIITWTAKILAGFNKLGDGTKKFVAFPIILAALAGPVVMLTGLLANLWGQSMKLGAGVIGLATKFDVQTVSQKAAAMAARQQEQAMVKEIGVVEMLTMQLDKLTIAQALANRETRRAVLESMVRSGMPARQAVTQLNTVAPLNSIGRASGTMVQNTEKASRNWKGMAASATLVVGSMALMQASSNKTVDNIAQWVMYAAMLGPLVGGVGPKLVAGYKAAKVAAAGATTEMQVLRMGAAGFAEEMGAATLATGGVLIGLTALVGGLLLVKHHQDDIAAKQKALLDAQVRANDTLVTTSAHFAENLGKAAGSYNSIIQSGPGAGRSSLGINSPVGGMAYKSFQYYSSDPQGVAEAKSLKDSLSSTDSMMAKLKQEYLDMQQIGGLSAKQAMQAIQGQLIAVGKSGQDALYIAGQVYAQFGKLKDMNWGSAMANSMQVARDELNKTITMADNANQPNYIANGIMVTDWSKVNENYKTGLTGIKKQLDEFAGIFNTALFNAMNPKQAKAAIDRVIQAAIAEFQSQYQRMLQNPGLKAMLEGKGITSSKDLATAFDAGKITYSDLLNNAGNVGSKGYLDPQALQSSLTNAQAFEQAIIGAVSHSNDLSDSINTTSEFMSAMAANAKQMTFKEARASVKDLYNEVTRAQGILTVAKSANVAGSNSNGVAQAKNALIAANESAKASINAMNSAKGYQRGATAAQALYNFMHQVDAETGKTAANAKKVADNINSMPTRLSIQLNATEAISVVKTAMSAVQDDMATSATNAFNARWDATMAAAQASWAKRENALQNAQQNATDALQRRQQNAQDAMDKRFQKQQDAVNKKYQDRIDAVQKEIKAEQAADDKRQRMFEAEKARLQSLADMANQNIDFNTAINTGNFDQAAQIRNNMDAQAAANEMDREEAAAARRTQRRIDMLNKRSDLLAKQRDKELKDLQALEDAQKKHLERMQQRESKALANAQQHQTDALKAREDADMASMQKTRDYEEAMLNQRLDLFKTYIAKNKRDLERWMKSIGMTYDQFGSDVKAKGESWASYFQKALQDHIHQAGMQVVSDNMWAGIGKKLANKLVEGIGFKNLPAFQRFVDSGKYVDISQRHTGGHNANDPAASSKHHHAGGMVGSAPNNRGGIPMSSPTRRDEQMIRAQVGEFILSKDKYAKNKQVIDAIHSGGTDMGGKGGVGDFSGIPIGMIGSMFKSGAETGIKGIAALAKSAYKPNRSDSVSGGFKPGPGGHHRPVAGPVTNGLHDQWTGYPAVDMAGPVGRPVYAVANGTITRSYDIAGPLPTDSYHGDGPYGSYGRVVYMKTDGGPSVLYAHLDKRSVSSGQRVLGGSVIGYSGNTGNSSGPHLHFGDTDGNPYEFLRKGGTIRWDNTPAMLHKGETVLTDSLTRQFKDNVASGGGNNYSVTVNVPDGSDLDANEVADLAVAKLKRMEARKPRQGRRG